MKYDYLIIGQGLAGSVMAYQLLQRGKRIAIIDENEKNTSSKVAAGLINPITGPKMVKSWRAEILFPYLIEFYQNIEKRTGASFFSQRILYRPFASIEDLNDWYGRSAKSGYQRFIHRICDPGTHGKFVHDLYGGVEIKAYSLNVPFFIEVMRDYFEQRCDLIENRFQEMDLNIQSDFARYQDIEASKVIFCNGYKVKDSKYFGWIPIAPVKGEILYVEFEHEFQTIYNRTCFIIPVDGCRYKVGSTYDRNDITKKITDSGRNEICKKLDTLSPMNYRILDQRAGVRPGSVPRRPLIGAHPTYDQLFVFNGLGTKGVSLAPYFSKELTDCLEDGKNMDEEVDIKKYYSLYFNSQFQVES